ncbi:MAG: DUF4397 domain-containing protein [Myxococcales bacterium]|nr:DUF4397 domain-containing protein [Myxococcales bacterium]MCB9533828.1 DUF4397 domain-containing protein [Myxococcales bacterium]
MNFRALVAFASLSVAATACGGSQTPATPSSAPTNEVVVETVVEAVPTASVRWVHAATAAPAIISAEGAPVSEALQDFSFQTSRATVPAGTHTFSARPSGGGAEIVSSELTFDADGSYTAVLVGNADSASVISFADEFADPGAGNAAIRFVHAVPNGPTVSFGAPGGRGYAGGVNFGGVTGWYNVPVDSGSVEVTVDGEVAYTGALPLAEGMAFTVVVRPNGDGISFLTVGEHI